MRPGRACIWPSDAAGQKVSGFSQAGLSSGFPSVGPVVLGAMVSRHITSGTWQELSKQHPWKNWSTSPHLCHKSPLGQAFTPTAP